MRNMTYEESLNDLERPNLEKIKLMLVLKKMEMEYSLWLQGTELGAKVLNCCRDF